MANSPFCSWAADWEEQSKAINANSSCLHGTGSLSFHKLCMLRCHRTPFGCKPGNLPAAATRPARNRSLWIAQQGLQDARAETANISPTLEVITKAIIPS